MLSLAKLLVGPATEILGRVIPDKNKAAEMAHEIATMAENQHHEITKAQIEVNKVEAAHKSLFVAGWRPCIGWICGTALFWNFVLQPVVTWIAFMNGTDLQGMPELDSGELMTVLLGMLGLGGMRTYEKKHGVQREK